MSAPSRNELRGEDAGAEDGGAEDQSAHGELGDAGDDVTARAAAGEPRAEDDQEAAEEGVGVAARGGRLARVHGLDRGRARDGGPSGAEPPEPGGEEAA